MLTWIMTMLTFSRYTPTARSDIFIRSSMTGQQLTGQEPGEPATTPMPPAPPEDPPKPDEPAEIPLNDPANEDMTPYTPPVNGDKTDKNKLKFLK